MELSRHYYSNGWVRTGNASHATTGLGGKASSLAKSLTGQIARILDESMDSFPFIKVGGKSSYAAGCLRPGDPLDERDR